MSNSSAMSTDIPLDEKLEFAAPAFAKCNRDSGTYDSVGNRLELSPLLRASCWGFNDLVKQLVEDGADATETDPKGETALHKASRFAHLEVAITLLRNNCAVDARDNLGMTPLHWAALSGNTQMARLLLLHRADANLRDRYAGGMNAREMAELMGHHAVLGIMDKYRWAGEQA